MSAEAVQAASMAFKKALIERALGAELIEAGDDFQAAREHAQRLAAQDGLHMVPSFHPDLVAGQRPPAGAKA